ncbi:SHOCT domain-containing protein [Leptospira biflexa]|nr:SHOCT domain-containing protein [Leptospira biflexa]TGM37529.1 SHOCT domain-containing protein [Leptospira biflexa]TGM40864.1 SHOCT domain-containing protein [Leptospira biflexa]TGM55738.1 SHOCT domain-containing protein [Leptospira biflexa]
MIDSTASIAFFEIEEEVWKELFPKKLRDLPLSSNHLEELPKILASVQYKRGILAYEDWDQLVPESYLLEIQKFVDKIKEGKETKVFLCSFKIDDLLAPNVKILKTSFYVMGTENGIVILFQEINTNISFSTQYTFEDWVLFQPVPIKPIYKPELWIKNKNSLSLFQDLSLSKNSIYGNIIVYLDNELLAKPAIYRYPKEDDTPTQQEQWKSVPEKLKALEEMRKNQLITDEEYQKKKTELLKEF